MIAIVIAFKPRDQFQIDQDENTPFWVVPRAAMPTDIVLNQTVFLKTIVLRATPEGYTVDDINQTLHPHLGEIRVLNLGVLERNASNAPVVAKSANTLACTATLSVAVTPLQGQPTLDKTAVDNLVNNFYTKSDLVTFLSNQLGLAMDEYAGGFDSSVKTMIETYRLDSLRSEVGAVSQRLAGPGTNPFLGIDPSIEDLMAVRSRVEGRLADLQQVRTAWHKRVACRKKPSATCPVRSTTG